MLDVAVTRQDSTVFQCFSETVRCYHYPRTWLQPLDPSLLGEDIPMKTEDFLEDLESQIDPVIEDELLAQWQGFCLGGFRGDFFSPNRAATSPRKLEWPAVSVNTAMDDPDKMLIQQLGGCSTSLCAGNGLLLGVRSNFGVATLAMPFGTELFVMGEATNELPTCHTLGTRKIHELAESGFCPSVDHP
jgi:hypothetical protein